MLRARHTASASSRRPARTAALMNCFAVISLRLCNARRDFRASSTRQACLACPRPGAASACIRAHTRGIFSNARGAERPPSADKRSCSGFASGETRTEPSGAALIKSSEDHQSASATPSCVATTLSLGISEKTVQQESPCPLPPHATIVCDLSGDRRIVPGVLAGFRCEWPCGRGGRGHNSPAPDASQRAFWAIFHVVCCGASCRRRVPSPEDELFFCQKDAHTRDSNGFIFSGDVPRVVQIDSRGPASAVT